MLQNEGLKQEQMWEGGVRSEKVQIKGQVLKLALFHLKTLLKHLQVQNV